MRKSLPIDFIGLAIFLKTLQLGPSHQHFSSLFFITSYFFKNISFLEKKKIFNYTHIPRKCDMHIQNSDMHVVQNDLNSSVKITSMI